MLIVHNEDQIFNHLEKSFNKRFAEKYNSRSISPRLPPKSNNEVKMPKTSNKKKYQKTLYDAEIIKPTQYSSIIIENSSIKKQRRSAGITSDERNPGSNQKIRRSIVFPTQQNYSTQPNFGNITGKMYLSPSMKQGLVLQNGLNQNPSNSEIQCTNSRRTIGYDNILRKSVTFKDQRAWRCPDYIKDNNNKENMEKSQINITSDPRISSISTTTPSSILKNRKIIFEKRDVN